MKQYWGIILGLCVLLLPFHMEGQEKKPMAYTAFFKDNVKKTDGMLPVYQTGDKYYLEIPAGLLGREMFFYGVITRGGEQVQALTSALGVARFSRERGNRVALSKGVLGERASDTTSAMYRIMKERTLEPVDMLYNVVAFGCDGKSPIIEITSLLKNSAEWFGNAGKGAADASKSSVMGVKSVADGVRFSVTRMHAFSKAGFLGVPGKEGITEIEMVCVIRVLPEKDMVVRYADPRIGYQTLSYLDYGRDPEGVEKVSLIYKWNLTIDPKDKDFMGKKKLLEPEKPIVFYLSPEIPERFRKAVRAGILEWQTAFENAGFKEAIRVMDADVSVDLSLAEAVVTCFPGGGDVSSEIRVHPRTGEILNCRVYVPYYFLQDEMRKYLLQCGAVDERVVNDPKNEELAFRILQYKVAAEVGKVFGLLPNLAASAAFNSEQMRNPQWVGSNGYTVSVMDALPYNYAVQPGDGVNVEDLIPRVGSYDRWAILWGYKQYSVTPDPDQDRKMLDEWCGVVKNAKVLRYRGYDKSDPMGLRNDLGRDRVKVSALGMKNLERVFSRLEEITAKVDGESWDELEKMFSRVHFQYSDYLKNAGTFVAGRYTAPLVKGSDEKVISYVSRTEQKEAMEFMNQYLFAGVPAWYESELGKKNGWLSAGEMLRRFADSWLTEKLGAESVNILLAGELAEKEAYTVKEFFIDLDRMIFNDYKVLGITDNYRKNMQYCYIKAMVDGIQKNKATEMTDDYGIVMVMQARKMVERLETLGKEHPNEGEKTYYRNMAGILKKAI